MPRRYLLALDQGTTSSRALVFDLDGIPVATAQREFPQHYPEPGRVEHDPEDLWNTQRECAAEALACAKISSSDLAAVGIANQRETTVLWDRRTGKAIHRAIVWQDRRTADSCARLRAEGSEPLVTQKTGLRFDPYFSATKLAWLLDHTPGARAAAARGELAFGTVDTWLLWKLTGGRVHATDATNAARTLLFNLHTGTWDEDLLRLFKIPPSVLPEIRDTAGAFGEIAAGLPAAGAPITALVGDQQAALYGQACFTPGTAKATYGTGCFLLLNTGEKVVASTHNLLSTVAWRIHGKCTFALEGSVFVAGAVVQWLRDELNLVDSAKDLDALAASVSDAGGAYLVPAFTGLGAPHWDPYARGALVGLTRGTNRAHICRAALESIAFQTTELIAAMEADAGLRLAELRVDGGVSRSAPLLQMQADFLNLPVVRPKVVETTALGAAALAGVGAGLIAPETFAARWVADVRVEPRMDESTRHAQLAGWARAVSRSRDWAKS
ncbi:glycerol kinase [Verrucomicrobia bacterium IMCC26134]|nr:glycerol kinase [Verrucomicrobia bacterium IMCC26134]